MVPLEIILLRKSLENREKRTMKESWEKQTMKMQVGKQKPAKVRGSQKNRRRNEDGVSESYIR